MIRSTSSPAARLDALERALVALRRLRVEVEHVRPGLVLERIEGWHAEAADRYAGRAGELRLALAGAERSLLDAEGRLEVERERTRDAVTAAALAAATPDRPVSAAGAGR
ncbi:hypothetical protein [Agromyces sp. GXS1127]|uniref:hypothetical protein n=1 Tax=Agromyces sp. GXS1127 TaxID=3424181 RepID=UPI003D314F87